MSSGDQLQFKPPGSSRAVHGDLAGHVLTGIVR